MTIVDIEFACNPTLADANASRPHGVHCHAGRRLDSESVGRHDGDGRNQDRLAAGDRVFPESLAPAWQREFAGAVSVGKTMKREMGMEGMGVFESRRWRYGEGGYIGAAKNDAVFKIGRMA